MGVQEQMQGVRRKSPHFPCYRDFRPSQSETTKSEPKSFYIWGPELIYVFWHGFGIFEVLFLVGSVRAKTWFLVAHGCVILEVVKPAFLKWFDLLNLCKSVESVCLIQTVWSIYITIKFGVLQLVCNWTSKDKRLKSFF